MIAIVAVDNNWGIGKNNDLLFSLKEDMKFFKETTTNKTVIMGYNTLLSLPNSQPLKNRNNIILGGKQNQNYKAVLSLEELFTVIKQYNEDDVFVAGGAMTYKTLLPYCKKAYVTKVQANGEPTVFFPNLDLNKDFKCIYKSEDIIDGEYKINFCTYTNENIKQF